ncbi:MAG: S-adenosylmethionine:tRNA ribosyltransferase-isomerase, partial [Gammaproteobacteria bacterium]|nr:S-adenosylmethionine:tRNA ribosyltransferase-isomerase [Gammaproteobacteria bacterium]
MKTQDFDYFLPEELIAQYPLDERTASRLLHVGSNCLVDRQFTDLLKLVHKGDLLVFNNTRVIPARLFGTKATGGKIEVLVERILDKHRLLAHIRSSKSPKPGAKLVLESVIDATMTARHGALFELEFSS